jgi:DNA-binding transcriptional LysR family regulator
MAATMLDWNDLRYFLAVAEGGSTLAAGRALRVSQTTVARRIAALEQALGIHLFDKRQAGYTLTAQGEALLPHAQEVAAFANRFSEAAASYSRDVRGTVRITSEEIYTQGIIAPMLREFHERYPEIMIELDTGQDVRDLGAGEADVALRSSAQDQPLGLVGRQICVDDWTLYCSRDYASRHGVPNTVEELRQHNFVGGGGGNLWRHYQIYLRSMGLEDQVVMHHATSTGLLSAVRSGLGIAVLPCIVADADPELIACLPPRGGHGRILWLLTHERIRHAPRVRTVTDFLYEGLTRHLRSLEQRKAAGESWRADLRAMRAAVGRR